MKLKSFKSRIIVTVVAVISIFSSVAFYMYSNYLSKRIYNNTEENTSFVLDMVNVPYKIVNSQHKSEQFDSIINLLTTNKLIPNAYFVDSVGSLKYYSTPNKHKLDTAFISELTFDNDKISFSTFKSDKNTFSRAFVRLCNTPECVNCHSSSNKSLGYVVFDFSINQTKENMAFTRNFSISFTVFLVILLGGLIILLHYRFVLGALSKFQKSINVINHGDLGERVEITKSKELGDLAICFNVMLDNFQETTSQLSNYHKKELQDAQKLATIGEMSARLAHEIRNPITGIANAIEIIIEETEDEENKPILQEIKRQANRVNEAVSKLLKYAKSEKLNLEKQDINELIKSIVFFLKNQSNTNKITFILELNPKLPEFLFDKEKMETVLINICLNALQAIDNNGIVIFKTTFEKENEKVKISVEDNGVGIPQDDIHKIFKPFYTTKTEGTGLGMAIIKDTVDKHNGIITVESELEKGTIISLILPS